MFDLGACSLTSCLVCPKEVFGCKGPAGTKPCLSCLNIVQHLEVGGDPYLADLSALPNEFRPASDDAIWAAADHLRDMHMRSNARDFAFLEQVTGINYTPDGLLFDDRCRGLVKPVSGWLQDWMHVLCVQGSG